MRPQRNCKRISPQFVRWRASRILRSASGSSFQGHEPGTGRRGTVPRARGPVGLRGGEPAVPGRRHRRRGAAHRAGDRPPLLAGEKPSPVWRAVRTCTYRLSCPVSFGGSAVADRTFRWRPDVSPQPSTKSASSSPSARLRGGGGSSGSRVRGRRSGWSTICGGGGLGAAGARTPARRRPAGRRGPGR
jgi:hypothetical protein